MKNPAWRLAGKKRAEERAEKRAKEQTRCEIAQKLIRKGWVKEEIAETTELDLTTVESLYRELESHA